MQMMPNSRRVRAPPGCAYACMHVLIVHSTGCLPPAPAVFFSYSPCLTSHACCDTPAALRLLHTAYRKLAMKWHPVRRPWASTSTHSRTAPSSLLQSTHLHAG
jgi:hypothetical protein